MNAAAILYADGAKKPKKFLFATSTSFFNTNLPRDPMDPVTIITFFDQTPKALHKQLSTPELHERMLADFQQCRIESLTEKESATRTLINGFSFLIEKMEQVYHSEELQKKAVQDMSMTFLLVINDRVYFRQGGDSLVFAVEDDSKECVRLETDQNRPEEDEYYVMEFPTDEDSSTLVIINKELASVFNSEMCKELFLNEEPTSNKARKFFELLKKKNQTGNGGKPQGMIILFVPFVSLLARNLYDCANLDSFIPPGGITGGLYFSRTLDDDWWVGAEGIQRNFQYVGPPPFPAASATAAVEGREPSPEVARSSLKELMKKNGTMLRSIFKQNGEKKEEEGKNEGRPKREGQKKMN